MSVQFKGFDKSLSGKKLTINNFTSVIILSLIPQTCSAYGKSVLFVNDLDLRSRHISRHC